MTYEEFIATYDVCFNREEKSLIQEGLAYLRNSKDPAHDEIHIERLLESLHLFLQNSNEIRNEHIDFKVLLIAIAWHDTWRAQIFPKNGVELFYAYIWDGLGSMYLFKNKVKKYTSLDKKTIDSVAYCIKKHHDVQFLPRTTVESKILKDIDEIDVWSVTRLNKIYTTYNRTNSVTGAMIFLTRAYFKYVKEIEGAKAYNFKWFKEQYKKKKKLYYEKLNDLMPGLNL